VSHFVISFMKDVLGDNGRQIEICQRTVEIDAPSEGEATEHSPSCGSATPNGSANGRCMPTASRSSLLTIRLRPEARPQIPNAPLLSAADDIRDLRDQLAGFDDIEWIDDDTREIVRSSRGHA
jgi:hypothetical protein